MADAPDPPLQVDDKCQLAFSFGMLLTQLQMLDAFLARTDPGDWSSVDVRLVVGMLSGRLDHMRGQISEEFRPDFEHKADCLARRLRKLDQLLSASLEQLDEETIAILSEASAAIDDLDEETIAILSEASAAIDDLLSEASAAIDDLKAVVRRSHTANVGVPSPSPWFELGLVIPNVLPNRDKAIPVAFGFVCVISEEVKEDDSLDFPWMPWWVWDNQPRVMELLQRLGLEPSDMFREDAPSRKRLELPIDKAEDSDSEFLRRLWRHQNAASSWLAALARQVGTDAIDHDVRDCYERDHYLLRLQLEAGKAANGKNKLGPGKLRDHWDGLTQAQRQSISPRCSYKVGGASSKGKRKGLDAVEEGLGKARKERELGSDKEVGEAKPEEPTRST